MPSRCRDQRRASRGKGHPRRGGHEDVRPMPAGCCDGSVESSNRKKATMSQSVDARRELAVRYIDGDRFEIAVRSHRLAVDQPVEDGGTDQAPSPTELFVAALASCVAFYARRYLGRHEIPSDGLVVDASYSLGSRPARDDSIPLDLRVPP